MFAYSPLLKKISIVLLVLVLSACGKSETSVEGIVSAGPVSNGTVTFYPLVDGKLQKAIGSTTTDENGHYQFTLSRLIYSPLLIEVSGGSYRDEATGEIRTLQTPLRAVVPKAADFKFVAVTPLTEMAVRRLDGYTAEAINQANQQISDAFSDGQLDIINTVPADMTEPAGGQADEAAQSYGLLLAALSQQEQQDGMDMEALLNTYEQTLATDTQLPEETQQQLSTALLIFIDSEQNQSGVTDADTTLDDKVEISEEQRLQNQLAVQGLDAGEGERVEDAQGRWGIQFDTNILGYSMKAVALLLDASDGFKYIVIAQPQTMPLFGDLIDVDADLQQLNALVPEEMRIIYTNGDAQLSSDELPQVALDILQPIFGDSFDLSLQNGMAIHSILDLDRINGMSNALQFLGAEDHKLRTVARIERPDDGLAADQSQAAKVRQFFIQGVSPQFRLQLGNPLPLNTDIQLAFSAGFNLQKEYKLSLQAETVFPTAGTPLPVLLEVAQSRVISSEGNGFVERINVSARAPEDPDNAGETLAWEQAFNVPWLSLSDYALNFEIPDYDGALTQDEKDQLAGAVSFTGVAGFGGKNIRLQAAASLDVADSATATLSQIPSPDSLQLQVDEGPGVNGSLSARDFVSMMAYQYNYTEQQRQEAEAAAPNLVLKGLVPEGMTLAELEAANDGPIGARIQLQKMQDEQTPPQEYWDIRLDGAVEILGAEAQLSAFTKRSDQSEYYLLMKLGTPVPLSSMIAMANGDASLLDNYQIDDLTFLYSSRAALLSRDDLSPEAAALLDPVLLETGETTYAMNVNPGLQLFTSLDLGVIDVVRNGLEFIGARSMRMPVYAAIEKLGDSRDISGASTVSSFSFAGQLPSFDMQWGDAMPLNSTADLGFNSGIDGAGNYHFAIEGLFVYHPESDNQQLRLDMSAGRDMFDQGQQQKVLDIAVYPANDSEPWRGLFGISWLNLENYGLNFTVRKYSDAVPLDQRQPSSVQVSGLTTMGGKQMNVGFELLLDGARPTANNVELAVLDGPGTNGSIALNDFIDVMDYVLNTPQFIIDARPTLPDIGLFGVIPDGMSLAEAEAANGGPIGPRIQFSLNDPDPQVAGDESWQSAFAAQARVLAMDMNVVIFTRDGVVNMVMEPMAGLVNMSDLVSVANDNLDLPDFLTLDDLGIGRKIFTWSSDGATFNSDEIPAEATAILSQVMDTPFSFNASAGLMLHSTLDLDAIPGLSQGLEFLGATNRQTQVSMLILPRGSNIGNKAISQKIEFFAEMAGFDLQLGSYLDLKQFVKPVFHVVKDSIRFDISLEKDITMPLGPYDVPVNLDMTLAVGKLNPGESRLSLNANGAEPWVGAFGAPWLTLDNLGIGIGIPATPLEPFGLSLTGGAMVAGKALLLGMDINIGGVTGVVPLPERISFTIHDGPGKLGGLSVNDTIAFMDFMFTAAGVDANLDSSIKLPDVRVQGVIPPGDDLASYEEALGHPVGPVFEILPSVIPGAPPGFNLKGELVVLGEPLLQVENWTVGIMEGIHLSAASTDYRIADAFVFPSFSLQADVEGAYSVLGNPQVYSADALPAIVGGLATNIANMSVNIQGNADLLGLVGQDVTFSISGLTQRSEFTTSALFGAIQSNVQIQASVNPYNPGYNFAASLNAADFQNEIQDGLESLVDTGFSEINDALSGAGASLVELAQADLDAANASYNSIYAAAAARKYAAEAPIRNAQAKVRAARNNLSSYDYNMYYRFSGHRSCYTVDLIFKKYRVCSPSERDLAYVPWQAGRGVYTGALWVAEQFLNGVIASINIIPVEAYPEVIAAKAVVLAAEAELAFVQASASALSAASTALETVADGIVTLVNGALEFTQGTFSIQSVDVFGGLNGDSRLGIAMSLTWLGNNYDFDFSLNVDLANIATSFWDEVRAQVLPFLSDLFVGQEVQSTAGQSFIDQGVTNTPPAISVIPDQTLVQMNNRDCTTLGASCYQLDMAAFASDADIVDASSTEKLEYHATGLPDDMKMDINGLISGSLSRKDLGSYAVKMWVVDRSYARAERVFNLVVEGGNSPHSAHMATRHFFTPITEPVLDANGNPVVDTSTALLESSYASIPGDAKAADYRDLAKVVVSDLDLEDEYTYEIISGNDLGHIAIDADGQLSLTPQAEANIQNSYALTIRVTDKSSFAPAGLSVDVNFDVQVQPVLVLEPLNNIPANEQARFGIRLLPKPDSLNMGAIEVSYQETQLPTPVDELPAEGLSQFDSIVIRPVEPPPACSYDPPGCTPGSAGCNEICALYPIDWPEVTEVPMELANSIANRNIDRQYKVQLMGAIGDASLGQTRQSVDVQVQANNILQEFVSDTGVRQWGNGSSNQETVAQAQYPAQDADTGKDTEILQGTASAYTKLDIDGNPLPADATNWACVRDEQTGLMWASRDRIKANLPQADWPLGWDGADAELPGALGLAHASFGIRHYLTSNGWMTEPRHSYCGSNSVNLPTVTELQGLVNYGVTSSSKVDPQYFPDINPTGYLALRRNSMDIQWANLDANSWDNSPPLEQRSRLGAWFKNRLIQVWSEYYSPVGSLGSGLYGREWINDYLLAGGDINAVDAPANVSGPLNGLELMIKDMIVNVDFSSGKPVPANVYYAWTNNPVSPLPRSTLNTGLTQVLEPFYEGEIMYVIHPASQQNKKDEDFGGMIAKYFWFYVFQVLM